MKLKTKSVYKHEKPCSELAYKIVEVFMVVCTTPNRFFSEQELREKIDKVIMDYFEPTKP